MGVYTILDCDFGVSHLQNSNVTALSHRNNLHASCSCVHFAFSAIHTTSRLKCERTDSVCNPCSRFFQHAASMQQLWNVYKVRFQQEYQRPRLQLRLLYGSQGFLLPLIASLLFHKRNQLETIPDRLFRQHNRLYGLFLRELCSSNGLSSGTNFCTL